MEYSWIRVTYIWNRVCRVKIEVYMINQSLNDTHLEVEKKVNFGHVVEVKGSENGQDKREHQPI